MSAVIADRDGVLVSANRAFWRMTVGAAERLLAPPVDIARLLLHPDGVAPRIVNLDVWAWHVIDALRRDAVRNPTERAEARIAELERLVPDRPRAPAPDYLGFAVPLRLRLRDAELQLLTTLAHFGTAVAVTVSELRLEAFLPADEATASMLAELDAPAADNDPARVDVR